MDEVSKAGPGLLFGTIPNVLAVEGGEGWARLFFIFLFLLGIDSAFGLFEGVFIGKWLSFGFKKLSFLSYT